MSLPAYLAAPFALYAHQACCLLPAYPMGAGRQASCLLPASRHGVGKPPKPPGRLLIFSDRPPAGPAALQARSEPA